VAIQIPYTDGFVPEPSVSNAESKDNKGVAYGYAPLDANAKVPTANLPDQAALDAEVDGKITTHNSATTSVHGIANTANLVLTNDARLSDPRTPTAHSHAISEVTSLQTALDGKALSSHTHTIDNVTGLQTALDGKQASGSYAPATGIAPSAITGTAVVTNDSRLSDSRTPTSHTHGNITNAGAVGSTANLPLITTTSGVVTTGTFGTTTNSFCQGNDSRLSDSRTPTTHTHAISDVTNLQTTLDGKAPTSHTHGNITNDGKVLVPYGGIISASALDAFSGAGTYPMIQGSGVGGSIQVASNGAITIESAGTGYVDGLALRAGGSRFILVTQSTQNAPANLPVITTTGGAITAGYLPDSRQLVIACSDEVSNLTVGTNKVTFRSPYAFTLTGVRASVNLAPTGSAIIVDINENGTSVLSTKLSIDANEKTSLTAASPAVISDSSIANDAEITIDIDQIGSAIAGKGLKVVLIGQA